MKNLSLTTTALALAGSFWATSDLRAEESPSPVKVREALETARDEAGPYHLRVDCTDDNGARNLEVFESGAAIWDDRAQLRLDGAARSALLEILLRHRFSDLAPFYGGKKKADRELANSAPLRVVCRVLIDVGGLRKSSAQDANGAQSPELAALATELLDLVEPMAGEKGVTVADLDAGLARLADGALVPEAFGLRFVDLPARRRERGGTILRLAGGAASAQPYSPGRSLGDEVSDPLSLESLAELAAALRDAGFAELPVNLWSDRHLELEIRVLDQRHAVVARPFGRLSPKALGPVQQRFDRLVEVLRAFRSGVGQQP